MLLLLHLAIEALLSPSSWHSRVISRCCIADTAPPGVFAWATSNGAHISSALAVSHTLAVRGLIVTEDVDAGAVLVTLPAAMQLGVNDAAADSSARVLLDATPPRFWSARLGVALWSEVASGAASPFAAYITSLPSELSCCLAPNGPGAPPEVPPILAAGWPPTGQRASGMQATLRSLHEKMAAAAEAAGTGAPSLAELAYACAIAGSRAYRVRGAPGQPAAADTARADTARADTARLLPIVDLANYAPAAEANAELRNAPAAGSRLGGSDDPLAVSLYAMAPLRAGTEVRLIHMHMHIHGPLACGDGGASRSMHPVPCTLHPAPCIPSPSRSMHPVPCTLHPASPRHLAPCAPAPCTLHPAPPRRLAPCAPAPCTLYPAPCTHIHTCEHAHTHIHM